MWCWHTEAINRCLSCPHFIPCRISTSSSSSSSSGYSTTPATFLHILQQRVTKTAQCSTLFRVTMMSWWCMTRRFHILMKYWQRDILFPAYVQRKHWAIFHIMHLNYLDHLSVNLMHYYCCRCIIWNDQTNMTTAAQGQCIPIST